MVDPTKPLQGEVAHVRLVVVLGATVGLWWSWIHSTWDRCRLFAPQQHPGSAEKETRAARVRQPPQDHPAEGTELEFQPLLAASPECIHLFTNGTWELEMQAG